MFICVEYVGELYGAYGVIAALGFVEPSDSERNRIGTHFRVYYNT